MPAQPRSFLGVHTRRDFLKLGSLAFAGINLPQLLAADRPKRDISCIVIFQNGGASQLDTFDPKPDAPLEIRGSFKPIPTSVPGVHISELLPESAKAIKKFSIIRSMHSNEAIHERARQYVFSGTKPRNDLMHPSYGAVVSRELGARNGVPPFVVIPEKDVSSEAGFLGPLYDPFVAGDPNTRNYSVRNLTLPLGISLDQARVRMQLLTALEGEFKKAEQFSLVKSMDEFYQKAFDLISSPAANKAFNISEEPEKLRDSYGRTPVGQGILLARRLIEAGVRLATVFHGGYDTHQNNDERSKTLIPEFDKAFTTLLIDLEQRGLLETTLVLVIGDFGRTPKINTAGGRDHWPRGFSVALTGAGILGGRVIGKSDKVAGEPVDRPVSIEDLGATVYKALNIDSSKNYHANGRPVAINKDGEPVKELFA